MAVIHSMDFTNVHGDLKTVQFLHADRAKSNFETSLITGRNGSHKSSLLRQIVTNIGRFGEDVAAKVGETTDAELSGRSILCISGTVSDRFPQKELAGGTYTVYDVPNYTYVGQRVMSNLLSKKAPLETILGFALDVKNMSRFKWMFFAQAHARAGIEPHLDCELVVVPPKQTNKDMRSWLLALTPNSAKKNKSERGIVDVSYATAQWILEEFTHDDFTNLARFMEEHRTARVIFSEAGPESDVCPNNALRLGLRLDVLRLRTVKVISTRTKGQFSVFDLSSGEYQMLITLLAVGFCVDIETIVLIDEPENNLHPQWQRDLMASVFEIFSTAEFNGHVIISTHSPLIVGAAPEGSSVVDLSGVTPLTTMVSYGASSDELLLTKFGVGSSRNKIVVDTIQRAVSLVESDGFEGPDFMALAPKLRSIRAALTVDDPLIDVISALLGEEQV